MKIDKLSLLSRGWTPGEINHASKIIEEAENKKHMGIKFLDKSIYWALFFLIIVMNIICIAVVFPLLFYIRNNIVLLMVGLIGLVFGTLFTILIADIEHFEHRHHRSLIIAFALSAAISFMLIIRLANDFSTKTKFQLTNPAYLVALIYLATFLVPYFIHIWHESRKPK